ncbi:hypothetical protein EJ357_06340 [Streptomyces cyaneochromogenes]|uniref:Uncharacterized protein n=1 Tax=Streptomyces cyaneochromogenes TaxID=2496836 RepID=A0A3Q9EPT8_9ACTN|nr:hypothetical protein [Streptomyces cyaneochromogenes]AZQ33109.1 hypothetical protein EJ357_06340 [Streptomyces cyaneochromogenes]
MWGRVRKSSARFLRSLRAESDTVKGKDRRTHNLFEAAAVYVSACAEDDQEQIDEAAGWVSPEALSFGVSELACRAVIALARERDESPQTVARSLLGLPAA